MIFVFARLWRRAEVITDAELTEIATAGGPAALLRGLRAFIFAVPINVIGMGYADVRGAQGRGSPRVGGRVPFDAPAGTRTSWPSSPSPCFTLIYAGSRVCGALSRRISSSSSSASSARPRRGHAVGMWVGSGAADGLVEGGLGDRSRSCRSAEAAQLGVTTFLAYIGIQWWAFRRSDGGGEFIQRLSASRDEREAERAAWFFNILNYVVRTWPWVLVGLVGARPLPGPARARTATPRTSYPRLMLDYLPVGHAWAGRRVAHRGVHVDGLDADQLGRELHRERPLPALRAPGASQRGAGLGRPHLFGGPDRGGRGGSRSTRRTSARSSPS